MGTNNFVDTAVAMKADPELRRKVLSASSPDERRKHLQDAGITPPTMSDAQNNAHHADLQAAVGAHTGISTYTDVMIAGGVVAALA
jgi:hypothetical protein